MAPASGSRAREITLRYRTSRAGQECVDIMMGGNVRLRGVAAERGARTLGEDPSRLCP